MVPHTSGKGTEVTKDKFNGLYVFKSTYPRINAGGQKKIQFNVLCIVLVLYYKIIFIKVIGCIYNYKYI